MKGAKQNYRMVGFRIPPELHDKFDQACTERKISKTCIVTLLMEAFLRHYERHGDRLTVPFELQD